MNKKFWRDLYPVAETRRRYSRSSWIWIYLPVAASGLLAVGIAVAVLGFVPGGGFEHSAHLATIVMAGGLLAAGFISWLAILACLWGLGDVLEVLPALTGRLRLRSIVIVRSWKRSIHTVRRTIATVSRAISPDKHEALDRWMPPLRGGRRKGARYD